MRKFRGIEIGGKMFAVEIGRSRTYEIKNPKVFPDGSVELLPIPGEGYYWDDIVLESVTSATITATLYEVTDI